MRSKCVLLITVLAGILGLVALPGGRASATASPAATFQLGGFYQMVADTAHGHLFVSPGSNSLQSDNDIVVTNLAGKEVAAITGVSGASGMALSPDGSTLYAALAGSAEVAAISTVTLKQTATYPLGSGHNPADLAIEDGKIWVSYFDLNGSHGPGGYIGEIDPAVTTSFTTEALPGSWSDAPQIAVDPLGEGALVASDSGLTVDAIGTYNVSTTPPTVYSQPVNASCGAENAIAVVPGGAEFLMACNLQTEMARYDTKTLAKLSGAYPVGSEASSVTVAPDGTVAVGLSQGSPDLFAFHPGAHNPVNAYRFGDIYHSVAPRGLAWSADGSQLFAVIEVTFTNFNTFSIREMNDPQRTASTLVLRGTSSAVLGKTVTLTGKLALTVGKPPADTKIAITRTMAGSSAVRRFTVALAANDTFKLTDKPSRLGAYTYTAHYAGDTTRQPDTTTRTVNILRFPVSLTLSANASSVNYKSNVTLTAHLGKTFTGRTVSIFAQPFGSKTHKLLKSGRVSSSGNLSVSYAPVHSTAFSAVFAGDAKYQPRTVTRDVYVRAKVTESISGYFTSTHINGILYRVYHHTGTLRLSAAVAPNKAGECAQAELAVFSQGGWPSATSSCASLSNSSTLLAKLSLKGAGDNLFRIRIDYVRSAKDHTNLNNHSAWAYFEVVT